MILPVEVASFAVDHERNTPLIVLRTRTGERTLLIPVGPMEAGAIAIKSLQVESERPLTVDLVRSLMEGLGGRLDKAVIYDVVEQVVRACLYVETGKGITIVECRPSDAIALTLRCDSPIFVDEKVFDMYEQAGALSEEERLRGHISSLDTLSFGTYYLE